MLVRRSLAPNYRRHLAGCLRSWAKFSKDTALIERIEELKLPAAAPASAREPFSRGDWEALREAILKAGYLPEATRLVCAIIATRGIRCGDVLRLTRREVEAALETGVLAFEAKGERRMEFSARPVRRELEALAELSWRGRVASAICGTGNHETAARMVRRAFDQIADISGIDPALVYAHRFRHTYASEFLNEMQGDPEAVFKLKDQMGWANISTTQNYLRRSRQKELDEIERRLLSKKRD
jgi:integrase